MSTVSKFLASINKRGGIVTKGRYKVTITPPPSLEGFVEDDISMMAVSCSISEITVEGQQSTNSYIGTRTIPHTRESQTITIEFLVTPVMSERFLFEAWIDLIANPVSFDSGYLEDTFGQIKISVFDSASTGKDTEAIWNWYCDKVWVSSIDTFQLSAEDSEKATFTVTFQCYSVVKTDTNKGIEGDIAVLKPILKNDPLDLLPSETAVDNQDFLDLLNTIGGSGEGNAETVDSGAIEGEKFPNLTEEQANNELVNEQDTRRKALIERRNRNLARLRKKR